MKKQITTLLLATAVTLSFSAFTAGQAHAAADAVIVSSVNFRNEPNVNSQSYGYLKKGEKVDILSKVNSYWYKVQDSQGRVGYVSTSSKYINASGAVTTPPSTGAGSSTPSNSGSSGSVSTPSKPSTPSTTPSTPTTPSSSSSVRDKIISAGKKYLGTPYEYGSSRSNTSTFDCSDFVRQAFKDGAGITLPSDSRQQGAYVKSLGQTTTNWRSLQPGDLMFFMSYKGTSASAYPSDKSNQTITHVGIYIGDGKILQTYSKTSGGVRIDSIAGTHWEKRFIFGGSALK